MLQKINNSINTIEIFNCLLLGDFNFIKNYWAKDEGNSQLKKSFIDTLNEIFLVQMVEKPTRSNNILDLVCISDPSCIEILEAEESFALSDHRSIKVLLRCSVVRITTQSRKNYLYSKANYEEINKEIKNIDWIKEYNNKSMTEMWEHFK